MKLNKPSYGVFMVDIFASSVGIFILVSLLYIIESAKATSNEAMVEKFKTLIKRDLIPVDRYSLPVSNDPLHDWGVRARHAREKQEALILLLRDKVLLYHTNQMLDVHQIVDSDIILNYYKKYNKNRRLFLEIHYHDAYHTLKAKVDEALPENVHQWVHWAYNAGNINNPNPVSATAARPNLDMTPNGGSDQPIDPNSLAMPSSVGSGSSERGTSAFGTPDGDSEGTGSENQDSNAQTGEGSDGQGQNGEPQQGDPNGSTADQMQQELPPQDAAQLMMESIEQQLNDVTTTKEFVEQFMQSAGSNQGGGQNNNQGGGQNPSTEQSTQGESNTAETSSIANSNDQQQTVTDVMQMPQIEQQAQDYIRQNVFLVVPLHSPISRFDLDIKVPGFTEQQIKLSAVQLKLHSNTDLRSPSNIIQLVNGDAIVPISDSFIPLTPTDNKGWFKVNIIKVEGESSVGWLFGYIEQQTALLPLFENTVEAHQSDDYWFERDNDNLDVFESEAYNQ